MVFEHSLQSSVLGRYNTWCLLFVGGDYSLARESSFLCSHLGGNSSRVFLKVWHPLSLGDSFSSSSFFFFFFDVLEHDGGIFQSLEEAFLSLKREGYKNM